MNFLEALKGGTAVVKILVNGYPRDAAPELIGLLEAVEASHGPSYVIDCDICDALIALNATEPTA